MHIAAALVIALAAGCAGGIKEAPPSAMAQTGPMTVDPSLTRPKPAGAVAPAAAAAKAKARASASAAVQPRKNQNPPPAAKNPEPKLDVASLIARLRDTDAIGVFTKLALKNNVDDLMQQFRAHYQGGQKTSVASLRQPYDMLVLKVLAVVQEKDPTLAHTISASREAIWGILADRNKFNALA